MNERYKEQVATFMEGVYDNPRHSDKREVTKRLQVVAIAGGEPPANPALVCAVDARFYMARRRDGASPVYCSIWVRRPWPHMWHCGHGRSTSIGMDRESEAFGRAVRNAGVNLALRVDGRGMNAVEKAMLAIARAADPGYGVMEVF